MRNSFLHRKYVLKTRSPLTEEYFLLVVYLELFKRCGCCEPIQWLSVTQVRSPSVQMSAQHKADLHLVAQGQAQGWGFHHLSGCFSIWSPSDLRNVSGVPIASWPSTMCHWTWLCFLHTLPWGSHWQEDLLWAFPSPGWRNPVRSASSSTPCPPVPEC